MAIIFKHYMIFVIATLVFLACTSVSIEEKSNSGLTFAITKPRNIIPDSIVVILQGVDENSYYWEGGQPWDAGNNMVIEEIAEGALDVNVYGKNNGITIMEGSGGVHVQPDKQAVANIDLNVLLRVLHLDNTQEEQFIANSSSLSPFWNNIPNEGAAVFSLGDKNDANVVARSAWGDRGLYFAFEITDNNFKVLGNNIDLNTDEWRSDALIIYLSTGQSVNEVEEDDKSDFFMNHIRLMIEVGNTDIQNSTVKIQRFSQKVTLQFEEENTIQNLNSNNFHVKIIETDETRIVVVYVKKDLFTEMNFYSQPKVVRYF